MADDKKSVPEKTTVDKVADWAKIWLIRIVKTVLVLLIIVKGLPWIIENADINTLSGRQYAAHYNWSKDQRDFFMKEIKIPDGSDGWVSIATPPYYRMETSRTFDVEYDFGKKETVKEGPNLPRIEIGDFPSTFDVKAVGKGGILKVWLHRNPIKSSVKK